MIGKVQKDFDLVILDVGPVSQLVAELSQSSLMIDTALLVHSGNNSLQKATDRLKKFGVRFTNQVWPGDTLTAKAVVEEVRDGEVDLAIETVNQDGKIVVLGSATARID